MNYRSALVMIAVLATSSFAADEPSAEGKRFQNETAGFSIVRPTGWSTASIRFVEENRRRIRLPDEKLQEALQNANAPMFAFTRYPEPHEDLNPAIQVLLRPIGQFGVRTPTELLQLVAEPLQSFFDDFEFVEETHETEVSGLPAGHFSARYTLTLDHGWSFDVTAMMWVIPRGSFTFMIGMSCKTEDAEELAAVFEAVIDSVEIED